MRAILMRKVTSSPKRRSKSSSRSTPNSGLGHMALKGDYVVALVTAPDLKTARKLSAVALKLKLAACANIIPRIESHYWWKGKLESGRELLLIFKTTRKKAASLQAAILREHPYDTA